MSFCTHSDETIVVKLFFPLSEFVSFKSVLGSLLEGIVNADKSPVWSQLFTERMTDGVGVLA